MKAIALCYAGGITRWAFEPLAGGECALRRTLETAARFPHVTEIALLVRQDGTEAPSYRSFIQNLNVPVRIIESPLWNTKIFFHEISRAGEGFDFSYFLWADCAFIDIDLTQAMQKRHEAYPAEYTYADGWPYGLAPEILSAGTAGILARINGDTEDDVRRDVIFSVLQKDINSFDIETEISPVDLRAHRIMLCADTKRNVLLLEKFYGAGCSGCRDVEALIQNNKQILRTLPAFFCIQIASDCPQECVYCPYPAYKNPEINTTFMNVDTFAPLVQRIAEYADDAVIDISLWGESALHPDITGIAEAVLKHGKLSLVIETCGIGWNAETLENLAKQSLQAGKRANGMNALSWIISLDTNNAQTYSALRKGGHFDEAISCTEKLFSLFPESVYVQAIRAKGNEDDIEHFYKYWTAKTENIIIQKYDNFCGKMPDLRATDISPVNREACWHLMRDMYILTDGTVLICKEYLDALRGTSRAGIAGNVFESDIADLWEQSSSYYITHCNKQWKDICLECDEYYTFNF
ncbi:MAG: spiro-SPASM protein [Spirochaetaceae bacterium]|jgi:spiro-SPASM protein|nr:spiro-SPASM protein [Spirochaetaceae bacterium]